MDQSVHKGNTRDFSIVSTPEEKGVLKITYRNSDSPFKKYLAEHAGQLECTIQGPLGIFTLPEDQNLSVIFIAKGLGITPALSMARGLKSSSTEINFQIVWDYTKVEKTPYLEELREISKSCPHISLVEVPEELEVSKLPSLLQYDNSTVWYLCGSPQDVRKLYMELPMELNIFIENIVTEEFLGYGLLGEKHKAFPAIESFSLESNPARFGEDRNFTKSFYEVTNNVALVVLTDVQGTILYANENFYKVSQYQPEEIIGQTHRILKSGYHPEEFYADLWETITAGKIWKGEIKNRARDGSYYWVDTSITPIKDDQGHIVKYLSIRYLITERKNLETTKRAILNILEDFQQEKAKYAELTYNYELATKTAGIGVWEWELEKNNWVANAEVYELFEANPKEFDPPIEGLKKYLHPEDREHAITFFTQDRQVGDSFELNTRVIIQGNTERIFRWAAKKIESPIDKMVKLVGIIVDITSEVQSDKMKTDFISLASHQLRTPLTAIKWYTEMMNKGELGELSPEQKEIFEGLSQSAERMVGIVTALLNISRIESGRLSVNPEPISVEETLKSNCDLLKQEIAQKKIDFHLEISPNLSEVNLDKKLINEIYQNLITNAIKYTPEGGKVVVSLNQDDENFISIVSDTGYGIPENSKNRIFERFFRADNILEYVTDGTGLGLYLTKILVELSGGKIWFESEEGKGTTFTFSLPKKGSMANKGSVTIE